MVITIVVVIIVVVDSEICRFLLYRRRKSSLGVQKILKEELSLREIWERYTPFLWVRSTRKRLSNVMNK